MKDTHEEPVNKAVGFIGIMFWKIIIFIINVIANKLNEMQENASFQNVYRIV